MSADAPNRIRIGLGAMTAAYMAGIFYFSSLPGNRLPIQPGAWDHLLHFLAYLGLGLSIASSIGFPAMTWRQAIIAIAIGVFYGATDEWHQSFVPQRNASVGDWVYDTLGVMVGVPLIWTLMRRSGGSSER